MLKNVIYLEEGYIRSFMKGIIAGEGSVIFNKRTGHYNVRISAGIEEERDIYQVCLDKLGIKIKQYENYKEMVISKRENLVKLFQQRLMCLSPEKYAKFWCMMQQYPCIEQEIGYFKPKGQNVWNKIPQEKINQILDLYNSGVTRTMDIANNVGVSQIKVQRVLKENNLGKRLIKTPEKLRVHISEVNKKHKITQDRLAIMFNINDSVVRRAIKKYSYKM